MVSSGERETRVVSVFTGAGGLDLGLSAAGAVTVEMCESWVPAQRILHERFTDVHLAEDVTTFDPAGDYEILTAGFPCTDLSHAGGKAGIFGAQSGLVSHVFRIARATEPEWIVLENVPNLLHLHRGLGIRTVVERLEDIGYRWAYRTLDSRFAGVPQRRNRVIVMASRIHDPAERLLGQDCDPCEADWGSDDRAWGFYWTEGRNGLGLIRGAVPTLKGGSTIGLPSAPAVWVPDAPKGRRIVLPPIEAGEELQGFDRGWTSPATVEGERDMRWKLVGNAVTTGVGAWIGRRLVADPDGTAVPEGRPVLEDGRWPDAAWGGPGMTPMSAPASKWPERQPMRSLSDMVDDTWTPLSRRATKGFLSRIDESKRSLDATFRADLLAHLGSMPRPRTTQPSAQEAIRSTLWAAGFRFRTDTHPVQAVPHLLDLVHPGSRVAVDIRTCFWHGCPDHLDPHLAANARWIAKRSRVMERDKDMVDTLVDLGWFIVVCWSHDDPQEVAASVLALMKERRRASPTMLRGGVIGHDIAAVDTPDQVEETPLSELGPSTSTPPEPARLKPTGPPRLAMSPPSAVGSAS